MSPTFHELHGMYLQFSYREGGEENFPHFHVMHDGFRSQVSIAEGKVSGETNLTSRQRREVEDYAAAHREALMEGWKAVREGRSPGRIG